MRHCHVHDSAEYGEGTCYRYVTDDLLPLTPLCDFDGPTPRSDRDVLLDILRDAFHRPFVDDDGWVHTKARAFQLTDERADVLRRLTEADA